MAIKALEKQKGTLATAEEHIYNKLLTAGLFPITSDGRIDLKKPGYFLLNPETIDEHKAGGWVIQPTPGQSDPILQWLSSGPRTVTFDALVTADTVHLDFERVDEKPGKEDNKDPLKKVKEYIGNIASQFFKTAVPQPQPSTKKKIDNSRVALDISAYLDYYRSLLYPVYDQVNDPRNLNFSPPLLVLFSGNAISRTPYDVNGRVSNNQDLWVLNDLKIRITKQIPNLAPMEAVVSFQLIQYTIKSRHRDYYMG